MKIRIQSWISGNLLLLAGILLLSSFPTRALTKAKPMAAAGVAREGIEPVIAVASSAGAINMCSPINGSTISSPLHVIATGGAAVDTIEVWIDGNKITQEVGAKGSITFDLQFPLPAGSHRVHLNAKSSGTLTYGVTAYFTVQ